MRKIHVIPQKQKRNTLIALLIVAILFTIATIQTEYQPLSFFMNMENFWEFLLVDLFPPQLADPPTIVEGIVQTISMAIAASLLSCVFSLILAFWVRAPRLRFSRSVKLSVF